MQMWICLTFDSIILKYWPQIFVFVTKTWHMFMQEFYNTIYCAAKIWKTKLGVAVLNR